MKLNDTMNSILNAKTSRLTCKEGTVQILRELTPAIAAALLECMPKNQRSLRSSAVDEYSRAMTDKRWRWTGNAIIITTKGHLIDGQHRLSAVIASQTTLHDVVIVIVNDVSAIRAIDQNRPRNLHDLGATLGMDKIESAIASAIMHEKCDWVTWRGRYSNEERMEAYKACTLMPELLKFKAECKIRRGVWLSGPLSAAIRVMKKHKRDGAAFFLGVFSGTGQVNGRPDAAAQKLYAYLINNPRGQTQRGYAYIALRAFNAYRENEKLGVLTYHDGWEMPVVAD